MNIFIDILIATAVIVALSVAIIVIIKDKKKGKSCCNDCSFNCNNCNKKR